MDTDSVTRLLRRMTEGEAAAADELYVVLYDELRRRAGAMMAMRAGHTLQPTAVVHEAWLRVATLDHGFENRAHFLGVAAKAMRCVLIDHARASRAQKRDARGRVPLDDALAVFETRVPSLLELDDLLRRLAELDPNLERIVELRFFAGLTIQETATAMLVSTATVERGWRAARAWLRLAMDGEVEPDAV